MLFSINFHASLENVVGHSNWRALPLTQSPKIDLIVLAGAAYQQCQQLFVLAAQKSVASWRRINFCPKWAFRPRNELNSNSIPAQLTFSHFSAPNRSQQIKLERLFTCDHPAVIHISSIAVSEASLIKHFRSHLKRKFLNFQKVELCCAFNFRILWVKRRRKLWKVAKVGGQSVRQSKASKIQRIVTRLSRQISI